MKPNLNALKQKLLKLKPNKPQTQPQQPQTQTKTQNLKIQQNKAELIDNNKPKDDVVPIEQKDEIINVNDILKNKLKALLLLKASSSIVKKQQIVREQKLIPLQQKEIKIESRIQEKQQPLHDEHQDTNKFASINQQQHKVQEEVIQSQNHIIQQKNKVQQKQQPQPQPQLIIQDDFIGLKKLSMEIIKKQLLQKNKIQKKISQKNKKNNNKIQISNQKFEQQKDVQQVNQPNLNIEQQQQQNYQYEIVEQQDAQVSGQDQQQQVLNQQQQYMVYQQNKIQNNDNDNDNDNERQEKILLQPVVSQEIKFHQESLNKQQKIQNKTIVINQISSNNHNKPTMTPLEIMKLKLLQSKINSLQQPPSENRQSNIQPINNYNQKLIPQKSNNIQQQGQPQILPSQENIPQIIQHKQLSQQQIQQQGQQLQPNQINQGKQGNEIYIDNQPFQQILQHAQQDKTILSESKSSIKNRKILYKQCLRLLAINAQIKDILITKYKKNIGCNDKNKNKNRNMNIGQLLKEIKLKINYKQSSQ